MGDQMVFKRYELKYMLTKEQRLMMQSGIDAHMVADVHGKSTILSLYLDTPDYLLVRRSSEKPLYKEKLRLRSYGVAGKNTEVFIELKKKYESVVYKRRESMSEADLEGYLCSGIPCKDTQIMREIDFAMKRYPDIAPAVLLSYDREAYYGKNDHEFRMTFDENILWRTDDLTLCSGVYGTPLLTADQTLLEVKAGAAIPLWLVHTLSKLGIQRTSFSKYGTAYQTMLENNHRALPKRQNVPADLNPETISIVNGGNYKYA